MAAPSDGIAPTDGPDHGEAVHPLVWAALSYGAPVKRRATFERGRRYPRRVVQASQRSRLLVATADVVAGAGYADTTIGAIIDAAGVSKNTFYDHFASKEEAFLAAFAAADWIAAAVVRNATRAPSVDAKFDVLISSYLGSLSAVPSLTRMFLIESLGATTRVRTERGRIIRLFTAGVQEVLRAAREIDPTVPELSDGQALGLVGGINEMCVDHLTRDRAETLSEMVGPIRAFVDQLLGRDTGARG
jgi:AcrR family transcriptional regulator